jgi:hypothetical protein
MRRRMFRLSVRRAHAPLAAARNSYHFTASEQNAWIQACCALLRFRSEHP